MLKRRYLKVSVDSPMYASLSRAADYRGVSLASFVRSQLQEKQKSLTLEAQLSRIEVLVQRAAHESNSGGADQMLLEVLLLVRELVAERNAQVIVRVRQKMDAIRAGDRV